jgi:hypothetical protein
MRKIILLLLGFSTLAFFYLGCKKNDYTKSNVNDLIASAKAYLEAQKKVSSNSVHFIDTLEKAANWTALSKNNINAYEYAAYIPVSYNSNSTGLVYILDKKTNTIEQSYLLELSGPSSTSDPGKIIAGFYAYSTGNFTGSIAAYGFGKALKWEMGYKNGGPRINQAERLPSQIRGKEIRSLPVVAVRIITW